MKIKFDENIDVRLVPVLAADGHDVDTVSSEGLAGSDDDAVYTASRSNGRVLITLDLDFSNPFRFPPEDTEGIVVVRPPQATLRAVQVTLVSVIPQLKTHPLKGMLWIVEPGRIRVHDPLEEGS
jgi:predicted nuclease of predicted toxin-antitoxin system